MKKVLLLLLFVAVSCTKQEGNLLFKGEVKGLSQGRIIVQRLQDSILKPIHVIDFDGNSEFETSFDVNQYEVLYLYLDRGVTNSLDNNVAFFAQPGKMTLTSDVNNFINKTEVTGNENQELWNEFKKVNRNFKTKRLALIEDRFKAQFEGKSNKVDSLILVEEKMVERNYLYGINFCINNANRPIAPYIALTELHDVNVEYLDTISKKMSDEVSSSTYGKALNQYIQEINMSIK
ncbi:MAG: DUF4369 domain-containing protein [Bacteroidota bacterium]|nr:DUF4369 domain-containing protein [Bacteroidota bacterium]